MNDLAGHAAALGIEREYHDAMGTRRVVPDDALRSLVAALNGSGSAIPHSQADRPLDDDAAYQLDDYPDRRFWLLAVQLYGVRSKRNWGHGDFTDLLELVDIAAAKGAAGVGLNPLHALFDDRAQQASPYSPNSRLFLNILYIDVDALPEFVGIEDAGLADDLARARSADQVDYPAVAALKTYALRLAYSRFMAKPNKARATDFKKFRGERGIYLERFAAFEVLRRRLSGPWWDWPKPWNQPSDASIESLRAEDPQEFGFYEFTQWIADRQLAACQARAKQLGLPIGLYADLAVGVEPGGADAWSQQTAIIPRVEVGAPPDLLNTAGQAWGLAAFNPVALRASAFTEFRELIAATMRHAGAVRIDHVLGLNRLFLIPFGFTPRDGAYLRYPLGGLLDVIVDESRRHKCLVIGEDLGTVPDGLREGLSERGVWSYKVMIFERDEAGSFTLPQDYMANALVTFATHDLATFAGWQSGHDLTIKRDLGLDPGETDEQRGAAHWVFGEALAKSHVARDRCPTFVDAARFLARTPSRVMAVSIEDILEVIDQPNVPGTVDEHPNWRQKLPVTLESWADLPAMHALADALREEGRAT
ncbi:4-alpha-glucanotransferase [Variibacter gotjawalensis]|uniref:4-alpha-glucanotransferase n=1 Tax=Variibacter gotjawalensis TaxID=1333996 RepID=A0A0S3PUQ9_9BRAD|nr:4-alpha-glucanotransferase [Variibacter gotjawalensis]NIK49961.1 4-alpha-glucanotransferase [Variibacter gotjawalensis]RZS45960.1 4-alpha-glucanotransferase [Variibacter gotjawalensis]BAT59635.1 4-alpha-glucanotransferase [Variibacter gotjawalensis]